MELYYTFLNSCKVSFTTWVQFTGHCFDTNHGIGEPPFNIPGSPCLAWGSIFTSHNPLFCHCNTVDLSELQTWMILQKCLQGQSNTVAGKLHWVITRFLFGRLCFNRYRLSQEWWWIKETARAMFCVGQNSFSTHQPPQHYDRLFAGRVKTGGQ